MNVGVLVTFTLNICVCMCVNQRNGHLKPLGSHKPPSIIIDEFTRENYPDPPTFFEKYVKPSKAAIFRGAVIDSDAYKKWTDEYISENFGDMEVRLEAKSESTSWTPIGEKYLGRDTLRHFVENYHNEDSYIVSDLPAPMYRDFGVIPSLGACGEMTKRFVEIDLWWSGGNTRSILHKDAYNQLNCLLNGTKFWKIIEYKYEKFIHKHPEPGREIGGFSDINPEAVDLIKHPNISRTEWSNFTLYAGDCLFLPKSDYHQVNSVGTQNLAVSILFGRFDGRESLDFSDCSEKTDMKRLKPLSEFKVHWAWKGTGSFVMGRGDLEEQYRKGFLSLITRLNGEGLKCTLQHFITEFKLDPEDLVYSHGDLSKAFNIIDKNRDNILNETEITSLTYFELQACAEEIEQYEPSATYEYEYSLVPYERVLEALKQKLQAKVLTRADWFEFYKKHLKGTEKFADEIFTRLCGSETKEVITSKEVTEKSIQFALENWKYYWAPQYSDLENEPDEAIFHDIWNNEEVAYHEEDASKNSRILKNRNEL